MGGDTPPTRLITYRGLRPTDPGGRLGLRNPERGWRIETVIAEPARKTFGPAHHLRSRVAPLYHEDWWMLDAGRFEPFGLTLVQAYCYLTEFADRAISEEKLALLQESLDNLRHRGLKAVLRFAYERVCTGGRRAVLVRSGVRWPGGPRQGRGRSECGGADAAASLQQLQPRAQLLGAGRPALLD
ncbi:MAG: DUF4874 domain-containing protein [Verrucomicrobiales bacterium]|nr:DUF4874 domain-containing protein [Verrucomicrobiales bacterium]